MLEGQTTNYPQKAQYNKSQPSSYLMELHPAYLLNPETAQTLHPTSDPWKEKQTMLAQRIDQIYSEIINREKLKTDLIHGILYQEIRVDEELFKLDEWSGEAQETNKVLVTRKLNLERMLQELQKSKWNEYASCFRDIGQLKKELRDTLQEYWNQKRKDQLLG